MGEYTPWHLVNTRYCSTTMGARVSLEHFTKSLSSAISHPTQEPPFRQSQAQMIRPGLKSIQKQKFNLKNYIKSDGSAFPGLLFLLAFHPASTSPRTDLRLGRAAGRLEENDPGTPHPSVLIWWGGFHPYLGEGSGGLWTVG